jgi:hypothetical protein
LSRTDRWLNRADAGVTFSPGTYVRKTGTIPAQLQAVRLTGSPLGVHAAAKGGDTSLCRCPLDGQGKAHVHATGQAAKVAPAVACKFCTSRLVSAGVLTAETISAEMPEASKAYALDYGTRDAEKQLAVIEKEKAATA